MIHHILPTAVLATACAPALHAQTLFSELVQVPAQDVQTYGLAAADVDGDGDVDLAFGNFGTANRLLLNDGDGGFTVAASAFPADMELTLRILPVDVDGDGDLDFIVGNSRVQNRLYRNDGTGRFRDDTAGNLPRDLDQSNDIAVGDVDGDGDPDLAFGNLITPDRLFFNDGSGRFVEIAGRLPARTGDATQAVAFGDVDLDGDLDLVTGILSSSAPQRLFLNDGTGTFTDATNRLAASSRPTTSVLLVDVDQDGDLDLVRGNSRSGNELMLNDGTGRFAPAPAGAFPVDSVTTGKLAAVDIDRDGDQDLVLANVGRDSLYLNDGNGRFTDATVARMPAESSTSFNLALADFDGDGDLDLAIARAVRNGPSQNRVFANLERHVDLPDDARPGQTIRIQTYARSAGPGLPAATAYPVLAPGRGSTRIGRFGILGLDPANLIVLPGVPTPSSGTATTAVAIPNQASLVGLRFFVQALVDPTGSRAHFTNVVGDTIVQ